MAIPANSALQIGINGIKVFHGYLYWANSFEATIYRLKLDAKGYAAKGAKVEPVAVVDAAFIDDFTIDSTGVIWAATNLDNRVLAIKPFGENVVVEGSLTELTVAGDTAAAFGRLKADKKVLYVSTSGAEGAPVNGTITEGGKVVAIDTSGFKL
ncbi:putative six-bladed beta-propeller -like protein [Phaeoacremonium minimum UCRPA7]|uniref:Putative six-bladed beta-propeller-like protein n=1 Tax=Phaeoacremonium minimum (strain UCR-PA7) TaxID=1286976 RepID=R8BEV0_PHAM7|nr:putative six-bladed beta-propeller -like protein [Phaeoacremonium minimum UCRPA7]EON97825.1 putative six-bladed beta-propeller -like protein [Phaeoacremonium minimum UCRPA7]